MRRSKPEYWCLSSLAVGLIVATCFPTCVVAQTIQEFPISNKPLGIATGPDGALWFAESFAPPKIGRITTAGTVTEFPLPFPALLGPVGVAAGSDGALWFTEPGAGKIGRITTAGVITEFPTLKTGSQPLAITAGPDGA